MAGFGLGGTEMLILLLAVIFLFFGGKKLPELAKGLGRAMAEFQRGRQEVEREIGQTGLDDKSPEDGPGAASPAPRVKRLKYTASGPEGGDVRYSRVVVAARALGIDTDGKTEEELKAEIARLMGQPVNDAAR